MRPILLPQLAEHTLDQIEDWILVNMPPWAQGAVMGMSGGVDSSVVAALTARAFRTHNQAIKQQQGPVNLAWDYRLRAYSLPAHFNSTSDKDDAEVVAKKFGILLKTIPLHHVVDAMERELPALGAYDAGNMISRMRAVTLWTKAGQHRSIVMGTGNKDEDYGVGYYTLTGDGLVHLNPIGFLSKRLVRAAAKRLNLPDYIVHRIPTAGLERDQTDHKDLGYSYEFVELVMEALEQGFSLHEICDHWQVHHALVDANDDRFPTPRDAVFDVMHRHEIAKAKAALWPSRVPFIHLPKLLPLVKEAA